MKGNEAALKHGGRRFAAGAGTPLDEAVVVQLRDSVLADVGGQDAVSAITAELVYDFARACCLRDLAWQHIAAVGPFTKSGKRRAVVALWMEASARVERLGKTIGLERRAISVPTLEEVMG